MRYKPRYVVDDLPAALGASTVQTNFNSAPVGPPGAAREEPAARSGESMDGEIVSLQERAGWAGDR